LIFGAEVEDPLPGLVLARLQEVPAGLSRTDLHNAFGRNIPAAKLLEALRDAADGGGPMSPEVAQRVIGLFRQFRPPEKSETELTPHEVRILKMISEGHDYPSAAAELGVATSTVIYHMRQIFEKLQVHSKSEAVAKALRARLLR